MNKRLQGFIAGILCCTAFAGMSGLAKMTTETIEASYRNIKIYVDGKKINPTNAGGGIVEPFIYNGTTYLPVRAIANALGKAVYWDGPNYTVYLGQAPTTLEYPSLLLEDAKNIGNSQNWIKTLDNESFTDNYGNTYSNGIWICGRFGEKYFETLLNNKYSRFKATLYVSENYIIDRAVSITIEADGQQIYSSPQMTKTSAPVNVDLDVTGYNDFKIICKTEYSESYNPTSQGLCIGDAGFYQ